LSVKAVARYRVKADLLTQLRDEDAFVKRHAQFNGVVGRGALSGGRIYANIIANSSAIAGVTRWAIDRPRSLRANAYLDGNVELDHAKMKKSRLFDSSIRSIRALRRMPHNTNSSNTTTAATIAQAREPVAAYVMPKTANSIQGTTENTMARRAVMRRSLPATAPDAHSAA
jgi:hypothetical protein